MLTACLLALGGHGAPAFAQVTGSAQGHEAAASRPPAPPNELDAFMAKVLARRAEAWQRLHDYVLSERERFSLLGPGGVPLHGLDREFTWYVRDGYFVRSPVTANGARIGDEERTKYERRWLESEQGRAKRRAAGAATEGQATPASGEEELDDFGPVGDPDAMVGSGEPRFVSEAYFLKFKFEPGNYYLAGREQLDGRDVLKIEYYPARMFSADEASKPAGKEPRARREDREARLEKRIERSFDKSSLVTLWVDPAEYQIVKYTFDNVGMGFLPGRWLVRVTEVRASMTMGRYFDGVWLPREITMRGGVALASGSFDFEYARRFLDYRRAETSAVIRGFAPQEH